MFATVRVRLPMLVTGTHFGAVLGARSPLVSVCRIWAIAIEQPMAAHVTARAATEITTGSSSPAHAAAAVPRVSGYRGGRQDGGRNQGKQADLVRAILLRSMLYRKHAARR
jgi:hypothetical protein